MNFDINLLPWRETHRRKLNILFYSVAGLILFITSIIISGIYVGLQQKIHFEELSIALLQKEQDRLLENRQKINTLQQDKQTLLNQIELVQNLQLNRTELVKLLDILPSVMPDGVYLTKLTRQLEKIVMEGNAQTNAGISALLKNLDAKKVPKLSQVKLIEILTDRTIDILRFKLELSFKNG
jgi:type IV pilus assembly protein PilN